MRFLRWLLNHFPSLAAWTAYGDLRAAEELETLTFRLVAQDVQDETVYDEIGALRVALTRDQP